MGFVGNYAPSGLPPQMYDMPVIHNKKRGRLPMAVDPSLFYFKVIRLQQRYSEHRKSQSQFTLQVHSQQHLPSLAQQPQRLPLPRS